MRPESGVFVISVWTNNHIIDIRNDYCIRYFTF